MPSTKEPVAVVQPGPGRAPAGSIPASSLAFDPSASAAGAVDRHIETAVGAHAASAISTEASPGETLDLPAADVQTALDDVMGAVNVRRFWVLDANPAHTADFVGANALRNAVDAWASSTNKPGLFLRPGTYNWSRNTNFELDNITIVGARASDTIIAATGDYFAVARNTRLINLTINAPDFQFVDGGVDDLLANSVLDNSIVNSPTVAVASAYNRITNTSFPTTTSVTVNGSYNELSSVTAPSTTSFSVDGSNVAIRNLQLTGLFSLGSNSRQCLVENLAPTASGSVATSIQGFYHALTGFVVSQMRIYGGYCAITNVQFSGTPSSSFAILHFLGSYNTVCDVSMQVTALTTEAIYFGSSDQHNTLRNAVLSSITTSAASLISILGSNYTIDGIRLAGCSASTALVTLQGTNNTVANVTVPSGTLSVPVFRFSSATNAKVSNARIESITGGTAFQVASFLNSNQCSVNQVALRSCANLGTTSPLFYMSGCKSCVVDGVYASSIGGTTAVAAPMFGDASATANANCTFRNVSVDSTYITTARIVSLDARLWPELVIDSFNCVVSSATQNVVYIYGLGNTSVLTIRNSNFSNTSTTGDHTVWLNQGDGVQLKGCTISSANVWASGTNVAALYTQQCQRVVVSECRASGQMALRTSRANDTQRVAFTDCQFVGVDTASATGAPLARAVTADMSRCLFTVGQANVVTGTASTTPILFFGNSCRLNSLTINDTGTLTAWHTGTTVAVDNSNQSTGGTTTIDGFTIAVRGWTTTGASCSAFSNQDSLGTNSAVFEALGQTGAAFFNKASVRNLSFTGVGNLGAGARHVIKASGCDFDGVSIDGDGVTATSSSPWTAPLVLMRYALMRNLRLFTVGGFGIGGSSPYVRVLNSTLADSTFTNIGSLTSPGTAVVQADGDDTAGIDSRSLVSNCYFDAITYTGMQAVVHLISYAACKDCSFRMASGASMPSSGWVYVTGTASQVVDNTFLGSVDSSGNSVVYCTSAGTDARICGNTVQISSSVLGYPIINASGRFASISDNFLCNDATDSYFSVRVNADSCIVSNNRIEVQYTDTNGSFDYGSTIVVNGSNNRVDGNELYNRSSSSYANQSIRVSSGANNAISGNKLYGTTSTALFSYMGIITSASSGDNVISNNTTPIGSAAHNLHSTDLLDVISARQCAAARSAYANGLAMTASPSVTSGAVIGEFYISVSTAAPDAPYFHAVGSAHFYKNRLEDAWQGTPWDNLSGGQINGCYYSHGNLIMYGKTSGGVGAIQTSSDIGSTNASRTVSGTSSEFIAGCKSASTNDRVVVIDTQGRVFSSANEFGTGTWTQLSTVSGSNTNYDMDCGVVSGTQYHAVTNNGSSIVALSSNNAASWTNYGLPFAPRRVLYDPRIQLFVASGFESGEGPGLWLINGVGSARRIYSASNTSQTQGYWFSLCPGGYMLWPDDVDQQHVVFYDGYRSYRIPRTTQAPSITPRSHGPVKFLSAYSSTWYYFAHYPGTNQIVSSAITI